MSFRYRRVWTMTSKSVSVIVIALLVVFGVDPHFRDSILMMADSIPVLPTLLLSLQPVCGLPLSNI
jgi:hypothetical protein